jgi:hypothetical protein
MRNCTTLLLLPLLFFLSVSPVFALKKRVYQNTTSTTSTTTSPTVSVRLSANHQNLLLSFSNLNLTKSVSYELTYLSNNIEQGIFGSVDPQKSNSDSRSLYFGTCSKRDCTLHKNITGASLTVTLKLKTNKTITKRYKIKV